MVCNSCATDTDHCHGTLIVHTGHIVECTHEGCIDFDTARHGFIVDCFDLASGCICQALARGRVPRAS
ncbi:hypothetical protein [Antrihabitans sp. YC2-6]|uniref:hypothetical protein n=1 Tax=Antrihabitans sp. YC2-6 TaxID=2799498 RepID=UPI0018F5FF18|nr:hypothetical protein [Antrihabitans sp. YC2-6]MBJ8346104.1 hypothetical protein [Antrihabitans sp. YC2-6]